MSVETALNYIFKMRNNHVCLTGGEPLMQDDCYPLIYELVGRNYIVNVETNGGIPIEESNYRSYHYTMDIKCPSSGMHKKNLYMNLRNLLAKDEVKFVVANTTDYIFAKKVLKSYPTRASLIFSPCFTSEGKHNGQDLANWLIEDKLPNAKLGVQIHKIIGFS